MLPSTSGGADRVQQLAVGALLQHICRDTSTKEFVQVCLVSMASEEDDLQLRPALSESAGRDQSTRSRHRQIHDDQIDVFALTGANGLITRARLRHHGHVWLMVDQQTEALGAGFGGLA